LRKFKVKNNKFSVFFASLSRKQRMALLRGAKPKSAKTYFLADF
jgi:hypothetical protein